MATHTQQAWGLVRRQHGVITREQLLDLGFSAGAIRHRCASGRLYKVHRGVYAVGRPELGRLGVWMAAVLSCGSRAALSHGSAAALWGIGPDPPKVEVSAPVAARARRRIVVHRRAEIEVTHRCGIPVTTILWTMVDLAGRLSRNQLERAVSEADRLDLTDPEALRSALDGIGRRPGAAILRATLDRHTFRLTDSELERRFLPLVRRAGLVRPETGASVNGFKVDFYWPSLGLVVETDGLRYHRTPARQARDRHRDQAHAVAGLTSLRFTHAQVVWEPQHVCMTLAAVAHRLRDTAIDAGSLRMGPGRRPSLRRLPR
jgi:very-short-patch-repair endonuclease